MTGLNRSGKRSFVTSNEQWYIAREALKEHIGQMKADPFYRLTANVKAADQEETAEILSEIENLSDEDLVIVSVEQVNI